MKKILLILLSATISSLTCHAQSTNPMTVQSLSDSIQAIVEQEHIAGLMVGIVTKDSVILARGFGYAELATNRTVDERTLFRMGSVTKMLVSLGILNLVVEGKFTLEDELKKVAPDVPFENRWESESPVRIIHLLEHTSGFDDIKLNRMYSLQPRENRGLDMVLIHKNSLITRWKPGERTAYSNPNYALLGYIIERHSGKSYDQYLTDLILKPLGMDNTNFNVRSKLPEQEVKEYIVKNNKTLLVPTVSLLSGPQGSMWSCAEDMVKFLQMFLLHGHPLFDPGVITEMETPRSSLGARSGLTGVYALGNGTTFIHASFPFHGHSGITGTCHSGLYYNRDIGVGFVIANNSNYHNGRITDVILSFLQQRYHSVPSVTQPLDEEQIRPFTGIYEFESLRNAIAAFYEKFQQVRKIYIREGDLYMSPLIGRESKLVQTSRNIFAWEGTNTPFVSFIQNEHGDYIMNIGGTYYQKANAELAILKRLVVVLALFLSLSSFVLAFFSLAGAIIKKVRWSTFFYQFLPVTAIAFLVWGLGLLLELQTHSYLMSELEILSKRSFIIFSGTLTFGVITLVSLYFSIRRFRQLNKWLAWYQIAINVSLCLIASILFVNGWIGLRPWAM